MDVDAVLTPEASKELDEHLQERSGGVNFMKQTATELEFPKFCEIWFMFMSMYVNVTSMDFRIIPQIEASFGCLSGDVPEGKPRKSQIFKSSTIYGESESTILNLPRIGWLIMARMRCKRSPGWSFC